ncbi:hypothetical protein ACFY7H_15020 [Streptomyces sp. NPDC012794]|uniref:hypothetical protein n=1 Tax=Streptomyces sp. NPDC012794 TaxID=3364850 RepID=UPI00368CCDD7
MTEPRSGLLGRLGESPAADRVRRELEAYLMTRTERLLAGAGRGLGRSAAHLDDIASGKGPGLRSLVPRRRPGRRGGGGSGGGAALVLESVDVGVEAQDAYDQWTRYRGLRKSPGGGRTGTFRSRTARVTERIPGERIAWTAEGARGTTRGVVTFHALGDGLTRVLLAVEHHPRGVVERAARLCGAPGRRVRGDLRGYARFLALEEGEPEGRGGRTEEDGAVAPREEDAVDPAEDAADREDGAYAAAEEPSDGDYAFEDGEFEDDEEYEEYEEEYGPDDQVEAHDEEAEPAPAYAGRREGARRS